MNNDEMIVIWEAPQIQPPEFRLYYDDTGKVVCYTCEKLPGNFIVVDAQTFAQARPDVRVIDGKISTVNPNAIISKLMPNTVGQKCAKEDISIVVDDSYSGDVTHWKLQTYEYR